MIERQNYLKIKEHLKFLEEVLQLESRFRGALSFLLAPFTPMGRWPKFSISINFPLQLFFLQLF